MFFRMFSGVELAALLPSDLLGGADAFLWIAFQR